MIYTKTKVHTTVPQQNSVLGKSKMLKYINNNLKSNTLTKNGIGG